MFNRNLERRVEELESQVASLAAELVRVKNSQPIPWFPSYPNPPFGELYRVTCSEVYDEEKDYDAKNMGLG